MTDPDGRDRPDTARSGLSTPALVLLYVGLAATPLVLAAFSGMPPVDPLAESAAAAGMVGMVMMVAQIGSSGRFPLLSGRTGIDIAMAFHKWAAPVALLLLLLHPILLAGPLDAAAPWSMVTRLANLATAPGLTTGVTGFLLFLLLTLTALLRNRLPAGYGLWRLGHIVLAIAALLLSLEHILSAGTYAASEPLRFFWGLFTLGAVLIWLIRHIIVWLSVPARVAEVRRLADGLWLLKVEPHRRSLFKAGQFAWLRFGESLSDHPFSIASTPHDRSLAFIIQEAGDFTSQIGQIAVGTPVTVDGPHGSFTPERPPKSDGLLLISGGVGLAPIISILADVGAHGGHSTVRLVHCVRERAELVDRQLLAAACPTAEIIVLSDDATENDLPIRRGPLTTEHLVDLLVGLDPANVDAFICGPGGMMTFAADTLHDLGVPFDRIRYERFSYGSGPVSAKDRHILAGFGLISLALFGLVLGFAIR